MGCDGGTIPRRDELVRVKKKPEQVSNISEYIENVLYILDNQQSLILKKENRSNDNIIKLQ